MEEQLAILAPLAAVWALAVILPGPNFLIIAWTAASRGRRAAVASALGVLTGAAFWVAAGLFGLKALFVALPFAGTAIRLVGAGYLIWVGLQLMSGRGGGAEAPAAMRIGAAYRAGLATTLANPKSAAVAASLLAVALPDGAPGWLAPEAFVVLLAISATWYGAVAIVGSLPSVVCGFLAVRAWLSRIAGAAFVFFGVRLATER